MKRSWLIALLILALALPCHAAVVLLNKAGNAPSHWSGLSSDTKPTTGSYGSTFYEENTGIPWVYGSSGWVQDKRRAQGTAVNMAAATHAATSKTTPVDADEIPIWDSVGQVLNRLTWANNKATLKTYFDTIYATGAASSTDGEVVLFSGTGGKTIKRSNSITGLAKLTAGVLSAATDNTDYLSPSTGVQLQATTPGTQQTGNFNISGTGRIDGNLGCGGNPAMIGGGRLEVGLIHATQSPLLHFVNNANSTSSVVGSVYGYNQGTRITEIVFTSDGATNKGKIALRAHNGTSIADKLVADCNGNILLGGAASVGTNALKVVGVGSGTAPTTAPADIAQIWVEDLNGAGTAGFKFMSEGSTNTYILSGRMVATVASSATPTPDVGTAGADILYTVTALATGATFGAPTGTPMEGQRLEIRIKDDGTARALAYNAIYRAGDNALPTTTVISKTMYLYFTYNSTDSKWDFTGLASGF